MCTDTLCRHDLVFRIVILPSRSFVAAIRGGGPLVQVPAAVRQPDIYASGTSKDTSVPASLIAWSKVPFGQAQELSSAE